MSPSAKTRGRKPTVLQPGMDPDCDRCDFFRQPCTTHLAHHVAKEQQALRAELAELRKELDEFRKEVSP